MKKTDISQIIKKATTIEQLWRIKEFYELIERLNQSPLEISFWGGEENWASILFSQKTIGYLWSKYPIIIFEEKHRKVLFDKIGNLTSPIEIVINSLENKELVIQQKESLMLGTDLSHEAFSAEDLWFRTNI